MQFARGLPHVLNVYTPYLTHGVFVQRNIGLFVFSVPVQTGIRCQTCEGFFMGSPLNRNAAEKGPQCSGQTKIRCQYRNFGQPFSCPLLQLTQTTFMQTVKVNHFLWVQFGKSELPQPKEFRSKNPTGQLANTPRRSNKPRICFPLKYWQLGFPAPKRIRSQSSQRPPMADGPPPCRWALSCAQRSRKTSQRLKPSQGDMAGVSV